MGEQELQTKVAELEARLAALEPIPAPAPRTRADVEAELTVALADAHTAEAEHIAFLRDTAEPARSEHLLAIAAADATLRAVADETTRREKGVESVRQRVSALRNELWQIDHTGGL